MSQKKYHINPDSGKAGLCTATKRPCCYGPNAPHYSSPEEAQADFSRTMEAEGNVVAEPMTKGMSRLKAMEARVAYVRERKEKIREAYEARGVKCETRYEAIGRDEAIELNREYEEYEKVLTAEEIEAFKDYTGILYEPINKILQGANIQDWVESAQERIRTCTESLDSAIAKASGNSRTLFRRIDQDTTEGDLVSSEDWAENLGYTEGSRVTMPHYSSTSADPGHMARTVGDDEHTSLVLIYESAKGANVGLTSEDKDWSFTQAGEREFLLPRGENYLVKKVERAEFYSDDYPTKEILTITLEELPE